MLLALPYQNDLSDSKMNFGTMCHDLALPKNLCQVECQKMTLNYIDLQGFGTKWHYFQVFYQRTIFC